MYGFVAVLMSVVALLGVLVVCLQAFLLEETFDLGALLLCMVLLVLCQVHEGLRLVLGELKALNRASPGKAEEKGP